MIRKYISKSSLVLIVGDMNAIFVKKKKDYKKIVSERRAVECSKELGNRYGDYLVNLCESSNLEKRQLKLPLTVARTLFCC